MLSIKSLTVAAVVAAAGIMLAIPRTNGEQVAITVGGPAPICPYGYFDYAPYNCAPYGYYGPDWFTGGIFIGAGPWFHGPRGFYGHVDNRFDPHYGYHGPFPDRGALAYNHFQGNEARDGRGHIGAADHDFHNEHQMGGPPMRAGGGEHGGGRR